MVFWLLILLHI